MVTKGKWVEGPDGRRDMDVLFDGILHNGLRERILVECKDYNPSTTGPVGIDVIDAFDSKKQDLCIERGIVCSNSGFTESALRKAKRKGIGAISVLRQGDRRIKLVIEEKVYYRNCHIGNANFDFWLHGVKGEGVCPVDPRSATYQKKPVYKWLVNETTIRLAKEIAKHAESKSVSLKVMFAPSIEVRCGHKKYRIDALRCTLKPKYEYYSAIVQIDGKNAIKDWVTGDLMFPTGEMSWSMKGLRIAVKGGTPETNLPLDTEFGWTFKKAGKKIKFVPTMFEGVHHRSGAELPNLSALVSSEELSFVPPTGKTTASKTGRPVAEVVVIVLKALAILVSILGVVLLLI